jgi:hypothetical protein
VGANACHGRKLRRPSIPFEVTTTATATIATTTTTTAAAPLMRNEVGSRSHEHLHPADEGHDEQG